MKNSKMKLATRFFSLMLVLVMVFASAVPMNVSAASTTAETSQTVEIEVGETKSLRVSALSVKWKSSNEAVVAVSGNGVITGVSVGTATITASYKSFWGIFTGKISEKQFQVTVKEGVEVPDKPVAGNQVKVGETLKLTVSKSGTTTWKSSDKAVATVSDDGIVTGISEGIVTITATTKSGGYKFLFFTWGGTTTTTKFEVEVVAADGPVEPDMPENPDNPDEPDNPDDPIVDPDGPVEPEVKTYVVTFNSNGGSEVEPQKIKEGETATKPVDPVLDGYNFFGWFADEEMTIQYDFTLPVTSDITLYADWEEILIEEEVDEDADEVEDYIENLFGTNPEKDDTDGDGLSDYIEIYGVCTDPINTDTDGDGILDGNEDTDSDGLTNLRELEIGTSPEKKDTDSDGLLDGQEIELGTDPLKYDTDSDNVNDGYEVELGTDPLVKDEVFEISEEAVDEEDSVTAAVDIELSGEQVDSLVIESIDNNVLFPEDMPGYIGKAYDFSVDGEFNTATISFEFESSLINEVLDPVIYYFNEMTQTLEALETTVKGNIASAKVEHFSTYILLDRAVYEGSMTWEDVWETSESYSSVEIVLVIDDSGSMDTNDKNYQRLSVAQNLIDKLPEGTKIGIVWFASDVNLLTQAMVTDKAVAKSYLTTDYFESSGGTYMYDAINQGFSLYQGVEDDSVLKMMVVLSDGNSSGTSSHNSTITAAQEKDIHIYTVGLGSSTSYFTNYLKPLAESTGGTFYLASEADELAAIYENINKQIDLSADTDYDGIPDYYEDNMIAFNCVKIPLDKTKADTDGDGLSDSEEVSVDVIYNDDHTKAYVKGMILSHPTLEDTDYDGIVDKKDNAPLDNNFIGKLHTEYSTMLVGGQVNYRWFFDSNEKYLPGLSRLSIMLSSTIYADNHLTLNDKESVTVVNKGKAEDVLKCFGMENAKTYSLDDYYSDNHLSEVTFGSHNVVVNGKLKTVLAVVVRGTNGTIEEWSSNFDIGNSSTTHTDWVNRKNHKGFDISATRIQKLMEQYIIDEDLDKDVIAYWVTGHSRGAGIANIIGANLEKEGKEAFTYTFAAPNTTLDSNVSSYKTIFNLINEDDFVPCLPIDTWGYSRYGKSTTSVSLADGYEDQWEFFTGIKDYNPDTFNMDASVKAIGNVLAKDDDPQVAVYHYTCTCHGDKTNNNICITNKGLTEASMNRALAKIPDNALPYCKIEKDQGGFLGGWDYHMCQTPAYFMQLLAANMAKVIGKYRFVVELNIADRYEKAKTAIAAAALSGIEHPHYTESYYVLTTGVQAGAFK